jgi:oxygen-dependent protoporphyrinogen oxidase
MIAKKRAARHDARTNAPAAGGPSGGKLHSLRDGMESLPRAVADALGDRVRLGVRVASLARAGSGWRVVADGGETLEAAQVIVTTPARVTAPLLDDVSPAVAAELRQIVYASVAGVGLLYRREDVDHALDGYGFLAPGGRRDVLGCLFESTVFPNRAPAGHVFLRAMMGGARRPDVGSRTPEELILTATDSLRGLLGLHGDPVAAGTWHHAHAIPQYDLDHPARLQRIARCLKDTPGLHLGGAALRGASVNLLAAEGHALAAAVDAGAVDTDAVDAGAAS